MAARTQGHPGAAVRRKRQPAGRPARRHHASRDPRSAQRRRPRRRHGAGRAGGADLPVLGPADGLAGRRVRPRDPQERHQASLRRAVRAVQDREAAAAAGREALERRGDVRPHRDRRHAGREFRERHRARSGRRHDPQRRLRHRRRRRPQHRAQAVRHRVRRLHLARTLHRVHDAVRFRGQPRLLLPQLLRRPRRLVQLLQGLGRRPARTVAHGLSDRLHDTRKKN